MPEAITISPEDLSPPSGKNIIITGGSAGIGLSTARILASHGNHVVSLDRAPPPPPPSTVNNPTNSITTIQHLHCDITSYRSQASAFSTAISPIFPNRHLDAVFVNAGIAEHGNQLFDDSLEEPDRRTLDIDLRHVLDTLKLAIYYMRNDKRGQKGGSIVMTASLAGYLASAGAAVYSAAKHGVVGLLRALKGDCAKVGIAISVVAPGIALTNIVAGREKGESLEDWGNRMREVGVPINTADEVARVVVWLLSKGQAANGKGMLIQAGRIADVEEGYAKSRAQWMGQEMLDLFKGGRNAPLFPNKL